MAIELIVMGTSLGGLEALQTIFSGLDKNFSIPIAAVLHRSKEKQSSLVPLLKKHSYLTIVEPEDKTPIAPGNIYIAPMGYHLLVNGDHFLLSIDPRVCHARPSIDVLFDSAAFFLQDRLAAVLLTGSGSDGTRGLVRVNTSGGMVIVQDPATAQNAEMIETALRNVKPNMIMSLEKIPLYLNEINQHVGKKE
ncbi:MAG: chemotaxis protein CheB [Desulfoplanes sp.]|nr:chemotaxis protein CheB [Desulfoplanes sp.]